MKSLSVLAILLGTCLYQNVLAYYDPMMALGGGFLPLGHGIGHGKMGKHSSLPLEPELRLTCIASFEDANGDIANQITVDITENNAGSGMSKHGLMGMGMGLGYGFGYGGYGDFGYGYGGHGDMMGGHGRGLQMELEVVSNVAEGEAFVVFTKAGRPFDGCTKENFGDGDVLIADQVNEKHGMGGFDKYGMGMLGGYGHGMGIGYGMGFGMGHHGKGMYDNVDDDLGVVAKLSLTLGGLTTATVNDIGFTRLSDLAGRGVVVCSEVTYDMNWRATCEEPYISCCTLGYDTEEVSLAPSN